MSQSFDWMAAAGQDKRDLSRQSLGRALTAAEQSFAESLERVFASGVSDFEQVAAALTAEGAKAPSNGASDWTAQSLRHELQALDADLDAAYAESGYGA